MAEWIEGRVTRVLFRSEDGSFAVIKVVTNGAEVVTVGPLGGVSDLADEAPFVSFEGAFERHASFGHRFRASAWLVGSPQTEDGLRHYLASAGIPGVGRSIATNIVSHFGRDTTAILERTPERLSEVPGIGAKRAAAILHAWKADAGIRALTIKLRSLGLSAKMVQRIREQFGEGAFDVVTREPYRLITEVRGIGFTTADNIARAQDVALDDPMRVQAAVVHVLRKARDEGHCFVPSSDLRQRLSRLDVSEVPVAEALRALELERRVGQVVHPEHGEGWALRRLLDVERDIADTLWARRTGAQCLEISEAEIDAAESYVGLQLDPSQREAVRTAAGQPVSVITGGPGTGKTTLVKALLRVALERGETWLLASPTGRASRRLAEASGAEAQTLHRLLGFDPSTGSFTKDMLEPLEADGLLVDEASMIDVELMHALLQACPTERGFRLVLIGDADQLPSVGPGQVLRDLVRTDVASVIRLTQVHRQAEQSGIVRAARTVQQGQVPASGESADYDDVFFVHRRDGVAAAQTIETIVAERLPAKGHDPIRDIQVLSPMRRGPLGCEELNRRLQARLNSMDKPQLKHGHRLFIQDDRVLCTRNRYDHGVFNGDMGVITRVSKEGLTITFEGKSVLWLREDMGDLDLAYAMTVHKSQGSEYPAVVLALHRSHSLMLRRNLFYTALTRAREFVCVVGDPPSWLRAAQRVDGEQRYTMLAASLAQDDAPDDDTGGDVALGG
ncbi:MAG: ATP-dependent RecD-like DNA helicase [Myxococcota bacterium]